MAPADPTDGFGVDSSGMNLWIAELVKPLMDDRRIRDSAAPGWFVFDYATTTPGRAHR
jgi:hypothetical protein